MEYKDYAIQFFLCILKIEFKREKEVTIPKGGPDWIVALIDYLFSEYANSRDGLYIIGREFSLCNDFSDLKNRLISLDVPEFEEANVKCQWKEK